jgi:hypothetical protein
VPNVIALYTERTWMMSCVPSRLNGLFKAMGMSTSDGRSLRLSLGAYVSGSKTVTMTRMTAAAIA